MQITQPRWGVFGQRYGSFAGKTLTEGLAKLVQGTAIFHTNPTAVATFRTNPTAVAKFHTNPIGTAPFHE